MPGWIDSNAVKLESYLSDGGVVMVPLLIVCLLMWGLIIDRLLFFRRLYCRNMTPETAWGYICAGRLPDPAGCGGVLDLMTAAFLQRRGSNTETDAAIMDEVLLGFERRLGDKLAVIGMLAAVAPLLGLLGTVTGMMATFDVLAVFGTGNAKAMAGGISEALITTQTGLLIAIPGMYMKGLLDRRARVVQQSVDAAGRYLRRHLVAEEKADRV